MAVYCIDPARHQATSRYRSPKLGFHRWAFLRQCLVDLRQHVQAAGSRLVIVVGDSFQMITDLCKVADVDIVHVGDKPDPDERSLSFQTLFGKLVTERCCFVTRHENRSLYGLRQLKFALDAMPRAFTPWHQKIEAGHSNTAEHVMLAPKTLPPAPALPEGFVDDLLSSR